MSADVSLFEVMRNKSSTQPGVVAADVNKAISYHSSPVPADEVRVQRRRIDSDSPASEERLGGTDARRTLVQYHPFQPCT